MITLSQIISYLTCPRICYYRMQNDESVFTEKQAVREIYLSLRMGFDIEWAKKRARKLNDNFSEDVFEQARKNFVFAGYLKNLKPVDWDVVVKSEEMGIAATVDEVVSTSDAEQVPLFVALKAPDEGVWYRDAIRSAVLNLIDDYRVSLIYYAYSGELRRAEVTAGLRRKAIKLIERVKMVSKGFIPERRESNYCNFCKFREDCLKQPDTLASKFL